jgi:hypothetical protein
LGHPLSIFGTARKNTGQVAAFHRGDGPGVKIRRHPASNDSESVFALVGHFVLL